MPTQPNCIFCRIVAGELPASVVHRGERCWALMDIRPVRPGHVLVIPTRHAVLAGELEAPTRARIWELGHSIAAVLRASDLPGDACNFLLNDGRAANQTVPHVHLHVVPRLHGDLPRLLASLMGHFAALALRRPISRRGRQRLDAQATLIRGQLGDDRSEA